MRGTTRRDAAHDAVTSVPASALDLPTSRTQAPASRALEATSLSARAGGRWRFGLAAPRLSGCRGDKDRASAESQKDVHVVLSTGPLARSICPTFGPDLIGNRSNKPGPPCDPGAASRPLGIRQVDAVCGALGLVPRTNGQGLSLPQGRKTHLLSPSSPFPERHPLRRSFPAGGRSSRSPQSCTSSSRRFAESSRITSPSPAGRCRRATRLVGVGWNSLPSCTSGC